MGQHSDSEQPLTVPLDGDLDGVADEVDVCPTQAGVASLDNTLNGCPPDRDGDTITDDQDACPEKPGEATEDGASNGCPDGKAPPVPPATP